VHDVPRGPDVLHRVVVKRSWLERGEVMDLTLPRNLACAACSGGGCDRCERSGAITLRRRGDPEEVVTVPLPVRSSEDLEREPVLVLRIPGLGGHGPPQLDLPRGLLLLRVEASTQPEPEQREPSSVPPPRLSLQPPARQSGGPSTPASNAPSASGPKFNWVYLALALALVAAIVWFAIGRAR